jgi:2-methylcitrate dehydratase PrpD
MQSSLRETVTTRFCAAMLQATRLPLADGLSRAARRTLLNALGTAIGAAGSDTVTLILRAAGHGEGLARPDGQRDLGAVVPGVAGAVTPYWAALATGTAAHLDDFDDTHLATVIHPGASALATVLTLAPPYGARRSGAQLLGAFAAGCEAQLRIGNAISPAHYDHGWHITGTCGVLGAAVAASAMIGLDAEATARALSLAAVMTAGHREAFGSMTKPLHAGKAAANGILAARLAEALLPGPGQRARAVPGPGDPLGPGGVLDVLAGGAEHVDRAALGRGWELELNTFKTYPCGVVAHPAMDAAIEASGQVGDSRAITGVAVACNPLVLELMGLVHPASGLRARFSARHGIAAGLRYGRAGLAEFSDAAAADPEMTRLRDLITLDPDPGCARDAAVLRAWVESGELVEVAVAHTRGSAARPLTDAELLAKVDALVRPVLGPAAAARIRDAVDDLPGSPDITALLAAISPGPDGAAASPPAAEPPAAEPPFAAPSAPAATEGPPTTDAILALALAPPALADEMLVAGQADVAKGTLARFAEAVIAGKREGARGAALARALEHAQAHGHLPGEADPAWDALTSAIRALSAGAGTGVTAAIVCAAATALGDGRMSDGAAAGGNRAEAVAVGGEVAELVAIGLPDAAAGGWSVPVIAAGIGGCVAAGLMLGLAERELRAAIGIAATQAAGLAAAEGTDAGLLQAGKAAFNAVEAALLARAGLTSSDRPLEGRRGLYALFGR